MNRHLANFIVGFIFLFSFIVTGAAAIYLSLSFLAWNFLPFDMQLIPLLVRINTVLSVLFGVYFAADQADK